MKLLSSLILINCLLSVAASECDLKSISANLATDNIYVDFTQTKNIQNLSRPLVSKGQIWITPNEQLVWQTQFPIKSTMVMSKDSVRIYNKYDKALVENNPAIIEKISNLFLTILSGESEKIKKVFFQKASCNNGQWELELSPKNIELVKIINQILVSGSRTIDSIYYQEKRGDTTKIDLIRITPENTSEVATKFKVYLE